MTRVHFLPLGLALCLILAFTVPLFLVSASENAEPSHLTLTSNRSSPLNYDFEVVNETVHVYPQMDASVFINYSITFRNYGTDFEFIDIGFPNDHYDLASVTAYWSLEGAPYVELTNIDQSSYIPIGVQIEVPSALRPGYGEEGTLLVWGNQPIMVYLDTAHTGYVGYEFVPTYFDPGYCRSTEWLSMHLHFPNTFFNGTLAFYHHDPPTDYYYGANSLVYVWTYGSHTPQPFLQGISFPYHESYITTYYTTNGGGGINIGEILEEYGELIIIAVVFIIFFGACCWGVVRTSRGTGLRLGKRGYLPPAVKVEALGIRRGLTVVEAAVLNEVPLNRVFTMITFGLLKKSLITIQRPSNPKKPTFHKNDAAIAKAASKHGRLHYYERLYLKAITPTGNLHKTHIKTMLNTLIKTTVRKLEGYSRTDTKVYYTRMIDQAWNQIDAATTPDAQADALNDYAEWLLLTPDYEHRIQHYDHYYVPTWYYWWIWAAHPRPRTLGPTPTGLGPTPLTGPPITLTNFANATVLGTQNFANTVVTGFQNLANTIAQAFQPPPPPPSRSSFSGRSCACACACVSCACACAGGGR